MMLKLWTGDKEQEYSSEVGRAYLAHLKGRCRRIATQGSRQRDLVCQSWKTPTKSTLSYKAMRSILHGVMTKAICYLLLGYYRSNMHYNYVCQPMVDLMVKHAIQIYLSAGPLQFLKCIMYLSKCIPVTLGHPQHSVSGLSDHSGI